jgi:hypothetical protein
LRGGGGAVERGEQGRASRGRVASAGAAVTMSRSSRSSKRCRREPARRSRDHLPRIARLLARQRYNLSFARVIDTYKRRRSSSRSLAQALRRRSIAHERARVGNEPSSSRR